MGLLTHLPTRLELSRCWPPVMALMTLATTATSAFTSGIRRRDRPRWSRWRRAGRVHARDHCDQRSRSAFQAPRVQVHGGQMNLLDRVPSMSGPGKCRAFSCCHIQCVGPIWRLMRRCSASRRGKKYLQISVFRHNAGRAVTRWPAKAAGVRKPEAPRDDVRPSDLSPAT